MYEGIQGLSEETVLTILENDALRAKVERVAPDTKPEVLVEVVESAFVDELRISTEQSSELRAYLDLLVEKASGELAASKAKTEQIEKLETRLSQAVDDTFAVRDQLVVETQTREDMERRLAGLEQTETERLAKHTYRKTLWRAVPFVFLLLVLTGAAAFLLHSELDVYLDSWLAALVAAAAASQIVLLFLRMLVGLVPELKTSPLEAAVATPLRWLGLSAATAALGLVTNYLSTLV